MPKDPISASLHKLSRRSYSKAEIKKYLINKGFILDEVIKAIDKLTYWGYLDDCKLAENIVDYHKRIKPCGKYHIINKMYSRGINPDIIQMVIDNCVSRDDEIEMAHYVANKYLKNKNSDFITENTITLARYLNRKGFSTDIINNLLFIDK